MEEHKKPRWTLEQLRAGESILTLQNNVTHLASQKNLTGFGMPRSNVYKCHDKADFLVDPKSEEILRPQCGTNVFASQGGQTAISAFRPNVPKIVYKDDDQTDRTKKDSDGIIPLQSGTNRFASQQNEVHFGAKRNQVTIIKGELPNDSRSQGIIPFQSGTNVFASQTGMKDAPGVGAHRQVTIDCENLNFSDDAIRKSSLYTPWLAGTNKFASQSGSGGFSKQRDVASHASVLNVDVNDETTPEQRSPGYVVLPLQSGTNKFASQAGMTGYGTPRSVVTKTKWKQEWVEQLQEAEEEFKKSNREHRLGSLRCEDLDTVEKKENEEAIAVPVYQEEQEGHEEEVVTTEEESEVEETE